MILLFLPPGPVASGKDLQKGEERQKSQMAGPQIPPG